MTIFILRIFDIPLKNMNPDFYILNEIVDKIYNEENLVFPNTQLKVEHRLKRDDVSLKSEIIEWLKTKGEINTDKFFTELLEKKYIEIGEPLRLSVKGKSFKLKGGYIGEHKRDWWFKWIKIIATIGLLKRAT